MNGILYNSFFKPPMVGLSNDEPRYAWVKKQLAALQAGNRILDAGAGQLQFKPFCSHLTYVSQDFAQYNGQGDSKALQTGTWDQSRIDLICDITNIPEPDTSFDAIMSIDVFEHLPDPLAALKEFSRLLRPGGSLIITAPFCSLTHFSPYFFYTGFSRYFFEHYFPKFRFNIIELNANGNFFEFMGQELRRVFTVAEKYLNRKPSIIERLVLRLMLSLLDRYARYRNNSEDLLNFGYMILGQKET